MTTQGTLSGDPADNPSSPFAVEESEEADSEEAPEKPEGTHTFADFGASGQKTLSGFDE